MLHCHKIVNIIELINFKTTLHHIIFLTHNFNEQIETISLLTMNKVAYIALNKTLKYNSTVTFSLTFQ